MQQTLQTPLHPTPGNFSGSVEYTPQTPTPEGPATKEQVENSAPLILDKVQAEVLVALGEVATPDEKQPQVTSEMPNERTQAQYTDEVLVIPVATVEVPKQAEPIPTAVEAVRRVTDNASVTMNERLAQVAVDLEREGYGLAA